MKDREEGFMSKLNKSRSTLSYMIISMFLFSVIIIPLSSYILPVSGEITPATVLTPKWTVSGLGSNWESGLVIGDVNGDGQEDVVYAGCGNDRVYVLDGTDGSTIDYYQDSAIGGSPGSYCQVQCYDVDNDGVLEILIPTFWPAKLICVDWVGSPSSGSLSLLWETYVQGGHTSGNPGSGSIMAKPVAGDVDGDGWLEIFQASQDVAPQGGYDGTIVKLDHNGNILAQSFSWRACSGGVALADADNDGHFEIYQGDRDMDYRDGGYGKGEKCYSADDLSEKWIRLDDLTSSQAPVIADVNGDGIKEIMTGMYNCQWILDPATGEAIQYWSNNQLSVHYAETMYDIDGDGHLELLCNDGDHDDDPFTDVFDLVTGQMDAQLSMGPGIWDPDANRGAGGYVGGDAKFSPLVADIAPDYIHPGMEIICSPNGTGLDGGGWWNGAIMIYAYDPVSQTYGGLQNITRRPGSTPGTYSTSRIGSQLGFPVVNDIDGDGLLELVSHSSDGTICAFDSLAAAPSSSERLRSEVTGYGECRLWVAEHTIMPWKPDYWTAPLVDPVSPSDNALAVPISIGQLSVRIREHQSEALTYSVTTSPNIGSTSGSVNSGDSYDWNTINLDVGVLAYDTTYTWTVTADDGSQATTRTYTFRTELDPNDGNSPPYQDDPTLDPLEGEVTSTYNCAAQGTTDPNGDEVTNIYRWEINDDPVAQLLLPFDTGDETSTVDYSGNNNDGIVKGAVWVPDGVVGGAYMFDGKDDAIIISDGGAGYFNDQNYADNNEELGGFGNWEELTVEAWVYLTEPNDGSRIVAKIPSYALGFDSNRENRLYCAVWPYTGEIADDANAATVDSMASATANVNMDLNTWYHIAFTYKMGEGLKLYFNGQLVASRSTTEGPLSPSRGEPVYIGRLVQPFAGMIDDVRIYNYAEPAEQIYNQYMEDKDSDSSSSQFVPLGIGNQGDNISCQVIPTDSYDEGTTKFAVGQIGNSPPNVTNVQLYPLRNRPFRLASADLEVGYDYYDANGNPENVAERQVRWYLNDVLQADLNDKLVVPAGRTSDGDTVYCVVTVSDGQDLSEPNASYVVTIRDNIAPVTGTPTLVSSGSNLDDDSLTATAGVTTDGDLDDTTNIFHWINDGTSMTNLQMPFDTEGVATDYSGYDNDGVVDGATWIEDGVIGGALSFDGSDSILVNENGDSLGSDGSWSAITVEYWVKATGTTSTESVVSMHDAVYSTGGYMGESYGIAYSSDFRARGNRDQFYWTVYNDTGSASVNWQDSINYNMWHHVVCTYDGVELKLYVDSYLRSSTAFTGNINMTSDGLLFIGGTSSGSTDFSGLLDEVRIYPHALSECQVLQRYTDTVDGISDSETLVPAETSVGDSWVVEVIPNDSWEDGTAQTSTALAVVAGWGDNNPEVLEYDPTDSSLTVNEGDSLDFTLLRVCDIDGDALTFSWTLDTVEQATTRNWEYEPEVGTTGIHTVAVTVSDGSLTDYLEWTVDVYYTLTVNVDPAAGGSYTASDPGPYHEGDVITLTPSANPGYEFSSWGGDGSPGTEDEWIVTMTSDMTVTATFIEIIAEPNVQLVVKGMDGWIYYRTYDTTTEAWDDWKLVEGGSTIDTPAVTVIGDELYMVVRGSDATSLWFGTVDLTDDTFSGWSFISGSTDTTPILSSG